MQAQQELRSWTGAVAGVILLAGGTLLAGGFKIPDQSTRAMGMIDAFVAGADDASSVYYNPAGLTHLEGVQTVSNLYLAHGDIFYSGPGGEEQSDGRYYTVPNFYVGAPVACEKRLALGLGVYSPFGLGSRWGDGSNVRNFTTLSEIRLIAVNPTAAFRVNDRLSVGVGVDYFWSRVINRRINDYSAAGPFGEAEVDMDAEGDGWGWNTGLQYKLTDTLTLGLTYRSQVNIDYDGSAVFDGFPTPGGPMKFDFPLASSIDFPATASAGLGWKATPKLRLECAVEWAQWSTRDVQSVTMEVPAGFPVPGRQDARIDWKDSWLLMLGAEYALNDTWTLRAGYGFNQTPVPRATSEPSLPVGDTHAVSLGVGYRLSEHATLDFAYILSYGMSRTLNNASAPPDSSYDAISNFLSAGLTWQF